jgi:hypothetical protein
MTAHNRLAVYQATALPQYIKRSIGQKRPRDGSENRNIDTRGREVTISEGLLAPRLGVVASSHAWWHQFI